MAARDAAFIKERCQMNGFVGTAIALAYAANVVALITILSIGHPKALGMATEAIHGLPPVVELEKARPATQKRMRNPWEKRAA